MSKPGFDIDLEPPRLTPWSEYQPELDAKKNRVAGYVNRGRHDLYTTERVAHVFRIYRVHARLLLEHLCMVGLIQASCDEQGTIIGYTPHPETTPHATDNTRNAAIASE